MMKALENWTCEINWTVFCNSNIWGCSGTSIAWLSLLFSSLNYLPQKSKALEDHLRGALLLLICLFQNVFNSMLAHTAGWFPAKKRPKMHRWRTVGGKGCEDLRWVLMPSVWKLRIHITLGPGGRVYKFVFFFVHLVEWVGSLGISNVERVGQETLNWELLIWSKMIWDDSYCSFA